MDQLGVVARLRSAVDDLLEREGDRYKFTHSEPRRVSLVSWQTS